MKITQDLWSTFKTYLYIDRKLSDNSSASYAYKSRFNKVASYFIDKDFNRENFNKLISEMKEKKYASSHINNIIKITKHLDRWLKLNQLQDYTYFKEGKRANFDILSPSEIERIANLKIRYKKMSTYINSRQKALFLLIGTTGCRIGEALSLKHNDIYSTPPYVIFRETKNNDDRQVPISNELYNLLISLPHKNNYVFNSGRGNRLETQQVNIDLKVRAKKLKIKKRVWAHLFRHSYVTTMLEMGVDALDVAVIVGHKDPKNTLRYKNSLIGHYADVILFHPLLRKYIPWEKSLIKLKEYINKTFNTNNCLIDIKEKKGEFSILLKKN